MHFTTFSRFTSNAFPRVALAALAVLLAPTAASAQITGLFNTGVDNTGALLTPGSADSHYQVVENALAQAFVVSNCCWAPTSTAQYIWQTAAGTPGSVTRTFRTTFTLDAGFNPLTAVITGRWSTDNQGQNIRLNGVASGMTSAGFSSFTNFTLTTGFVAGLNTIEFVVADFGQPASLAVEQLRGTANPTNTPPGTTVPEPSTVVLMAAGLFGVAVVGARRKRSA